MQPEIQQDAITARSMPMAFRPRALVREVAIISAVWFGGVVILIVGTITNARIAFVWPMGQDIDWSLILKQGVGALAAEQEFTIDHRNPLSGWVYSAAAPLILGHPYGFHILRLLTCLFLGLSVYALARQLSRQRASYFPVLLGTTISIWWFWSNKTQVVWLMLFVLALSALIVWSYCVYVDSNRTRGGYYGLSLALWLVALGTYSIQCGAIFAIFVVALLRGRARGLWPAVRDTFPYFLIAVSFAAIWITGARGFFLEPAVSRTTQGDLSAAAAIKSIGYFLWHPSFTRILDSVAGHWTACMIAAIALCGIAIGFVLKRMSFDQAAFAPRRLREEAWWVLLVAVCLALPTLFLESTSSVWLPGTRSEMMYAAFVPMVVLAAAALASSLLHRRAAGLLLFAVCSLLVSMIMLMNLEQNRQAVEAFRWQKNLAAGLRPLQQATAGPLHFLVINMSGANHIDPSFGARFAQDKVGHVAARWSAAPASAESSVRVIETSAAPPGYPGTWRIAIGPQSVRGALEDSQEAVPASAVRIVKFDGRKVEWLPSIARDDLAGLQADIVD